MGVYTRFKRNPDGLRQLVELLESTPIARRQKMIDVGMEEDPTYTQKALDCMMTFEDILKLPDMELAEVLSEAPARFTACAIHSQSQEVKDRFIMKCKPRVAAELREFLDAPNVTPAQIGSGQLKMIEAARKLEKRGLVKTKKIPQSRVIYSNEVEWNEGTCPRAPERTPGLDEVMPTFLVDTRQGLQRSLFPNQWYLDGAVSALRRYPHSS